MIASGKITRFGESNIDDNDDFAESNINDDSIKSVFSRYYHTLGKVTIEHKPVNGDPYVDLSQESVWTPKSIVLMSRELMNDYKYQNSCIVLLK